ncbi:hypothetical protein [Bacillus gobiensis]|uniref:hypothetical protein n=1 Tax=Bacillus gobiensis TaxID=1441095 RepID=UPI003D2596CB
MSTRPRSDHLPGKVKVWHMTEEQRQAYIAKHPIQPEEKPKPFDMIEQKVWSKN